MTRVLIADPDKYSRQALALLLARKLEISDIRQAEDWDSLVQLHEQRASDVILLADTLPGLPPPSQALTCLRTPRPDLGLVLLSLDAGQVEQVVSTGATFIYKGMPGAEVAERLEPLLKRIA